MLQSALAGMVRYPQFFTWRLTWNPSAGKYDKRPCYPDGRMGDMDAQSPTNWLPYEVAANNTNQLNARQDGHVYALGFMLTAACGYWFLDLDKCVTNGQPSALVNELFAKLPGVMFEYSSSQTGVHFIGRGKLPDHGTRYKEWGAELYHQQRGICFGLTGQAWGSADTESLGIGLIAAEYFPPVAGMTEALNTSGPRAEWRGPTDDAELIRRAMASVSDQARLAGKATFADLWTRNVPKLAGTYKPDPGELYGESEADLALAQHLAYWTGCDLERMVRLMWQSALVRPKWKEHRTYLRELTCVKAIARQRDVLVDRERVHQMVVEVQADQAARNEDWAKRVMGAEEAELRNEIIPGIAADLAIDHLDRSRLAGLVKERFASFKIPVSIGECRRMLWTAAVEEEETDAEVPNWAIGHVYVQRGDFFFHLETGQQMSRAAFNATFNRVMPMKQNGDREEAAKWALERWNMATVADTMYRPDRDLVFVDGKQWYANEFSPASIPEETEYTEQGIAAINTFMRHLWAFCTGRQEVYETLLSWMAHNVQYPGKKIRWAPLLKGMQGDGKSMIADVLIAAMGSRNVSKVSNKSIQSDYNDWAGGSAVAAIEEMMMTGSKRYAVANAIKENVSNSQIGLNRKGRVALTIRNVTNYIGFTNHTDAIPLEDNDRKWFIVFSPFHSVAALMGAHGFTAERQLVDMFTGIFDSLDREPGQWRKWLMAMPLAEHFEPSGRAMLTEEKGEMRDSGTDVHEAIARQIIQEGAIGVTATLLCSASLSHAMRNACIADGLEIPKTTTLNHLLSRMGFSKWGGGRPIKWDGKTRRIWWKRGDMGSVDQEGIREILEKTKIIQP